MATPPVCNWNKYGYCKHRDYCRRRHIDESCESTSCDIGKCNLRHPVECKFFLRYNRCKFSPCKFSHKENTEIVEIRERLKAIEENIANKNKEIKRLDQVIQELAAKNSDIDLVKEVEDKIDSFQSNLETMKICMADKDAYIFTLEKKIKHVENRFETEMNQQSDMIEKLRKSIEERVNETHLDENECESFVCEECDFKSNSMKGLNIHKSRKHGNKVEEDLTHFNCVKCKFETDEEGKLKIHNIRKHIDKDTLEYPHNCHICEFKLKNSQEVRLHMDIHALERTMFGDFQCKDCHFLCDNLETMEVHFGKCSVDELFCGLCEWKSNDLEKLETHLASCEVYACVGCEERFLTLTDVKVHVKNEHGEKTKLKHLKMNRIVKSKVDSKKYLYSEV